MTTTRSPEQERSDALNLAYVARIAATEQRQGWTDRQLFAYRAGYNAGRAGWTSRGTPGMEHHERYANACQNHGLGAEWAQGHRDGTS